MNKLFIGILLISVILALGCTTEPSGEAKGVLASGVSSMDNYSEGDYVVGLQGTPVKIHVNQITQSGVGKNYQATLSLQYEDGTLLDSHTFINMTRLEQEFMNPQGYYALSTPLVISNIGVNPSTGIGFVTLEKNTWYENQMMNWLWGKGSYEGQKLRIHVDQVVQTGGNYIATLSIYAPDNTVIDSHQFTSGTRLEQEFMDPQGNYVLKTPVYLTNIGVGKTNGIGYIKATIG
ncbi:MAG: hypothetical protein ABIA76_02550 [Candidatus Diapherotrites archaeon]